jgi:hypothetical protein
MHGVPEHLDLTPFIGTTLDHVLICLYTLHFVFEGNPWTEKKYVISVEGCWEVRDAQSVVIDKAASGERDAYRIHRLLGHNVAETKVNPPESFTLIFDNGWTLTLVDDSYYDCCHIRVGDSEIHI